MEDRSSQSRFARLTASASHFFFFYVGANRSRYFKYQATKKWETEAARLASLA
jgi:hypothetical protein